METTFWRKCSSCKKPIGFKTPYWVCSVSTCTRKRTGLVFCSVACWDAHVPMMNHRDAGAIEDRSPSASEWQAEQAAQVPGAPRSEGAATGGTKSASATSSDREILIVASKLKAYIRERSGMNTSDSVMDKLSDAMRHICDQAIARARSSGRQTVMDRDF